MAWIKTLGEKGNLVGGEPLQRSGKQVIGTKKVITDGPFMEVKEAVGGYLIVKANTLDEAIELAKSCPALLSGTGNVEVRAVMSIDSNPASNEFLQQKNQHKDN